MPGNPLKTDIELHLVPWVPPSCISDLNELTVYNYKLWADLFFILCYIYNYLILT
jgi:hypothetical protein